MPTNVTADQTVAFDEAYALSGDLIDIDGTANIKAILPLELQTSHEIDSDGATQFEGETNITVLTTALPTLDRESIATISGTEYRITSRAQEGTICTRLDLITP